jgi:poly(rC)-binding protein 2/3/4
MDAMIFVQNSEMMHFPSQDALLRVYSRISEASIDKSSAVPARLLVPSQHIGCLLGKGGSIIAEMRKVTGASIRIFGNEQIPRCAQRNDELVQVSSSSTNQPLDFGFFYSCMI